MSARYDPRIFDVKNIDAAKAIILTPDREFGTEQRWEIETPYLGNMIAAHLDLKPTHRLLDYGTGIGRLAKDVIDRTGCSVIGVDTSVNMRALAPAYVVSDRFLSCAPGALSCVADVHHAISVWTLQHVLDVDGAIGSILSKMRSFGKLFVVNATKRFLPVGDGKWTDDGKDLRYQSSARMKEIAYGQMEQAALTPETVKGSFWGVYQKRT